MILDVVVGKIRKRCGVASGSVVLVLGEELAHQDDSVPAVHKQLDDGVANATEFVRQCLYPPWESAPPHQGRPAFRV